MLPARAPRRRVLAAALAAVVAPGLLAGLTACSTSAPARLDTSETTLVEPAPTSTEELLDEPEESFSTVGALADGFPADLVPLPLDADILVSSARPSPDDPDLLEISLNLRTTLSADDLVASLTTALADQGFTAAPAASPPAGLAATGTFTRGEGELITVAVLDRDGVRTLTIGGTVAPAGA
ncbi:hypothetical protein [Cellulomonas composti]|uniref:GerMN domain-containing protein n=1 Tax=Cellulomonas composti TaxID=266130 RepID=A0A511J713_9CELL|nr:hypothetical protein [Cellulomonas composti]GEL93796.1 hypothetical protein CCO02nite_04540 [Cellulomonas composti]